MRIYIYIYIYTCAFVNASAGCLPVRGSWSPPSLESGMIITNNNNSNNKNTNI